MTGSALAELGLVQQQGAEIQKEFNTLILV